MADIAISHIKLPVLTNTKYPGFVVLDLSGDVYIPMHIYHGIIGDPFPAGRSTIKAFITEESAWAYIEKLEG